MTALRSAALAGLLLCAGCTASQPPAASPGPTAPPPAAAPTSTPARSPAGAGTLLALGDSVAYGVGAPAPARDGYVPLLADRLPGPGLDVRNLAVPGATTRSMARSQVPRALAVLREEDVRLVTVTIGGNDVFGPVLQACGGDPAEARCRSAVRGALASVADGLDEGLGALAAAVPPGTPVAVMAYFDPLPSCRLAPLAALSRQVLEGSGDEPGLNDVLREQAAAAGALVVETADRVSGAGLVGGDDCLHPSGSGHAAISDAFLERVRDRT